MTFTTSPTDVISRTLDSSLRSHRPISSDDYGTGSLGSGIAAQTTITSANAETARGQRSIQADILGVMAAAMLPLEFAAVKCGSPGLSMGYRGNPQ